MGTAHGQGTCKDVAPKAWLQVGQDGQELWYLGHGGGHVWSRTGTVKIRKRYDYVKSVTLVYNSERAYRLHFSFLGIFDIEFDIRHGIRRWNGRRAQRRNWNWNLAGMEAYEGRSI